jgi:predicted metal-dependent hydrolase
MSDDRHNQPPASPLDAGDASPTPIEIIRSSRRKNTSSAQRRAGRIVVRVPAGLSPTQEQETVNNLLLALDRQTRRRALNADRNLAERAAELNKRYFDGKLKYNSIEYVTNQQRRYGSCTPTTGSIRISDHLATMPAWVLDYVIVHELTHLREANHSTAFWKLVNRYPLAERARGYLIAVGMEEAELSHIRRQA